MTTKKQSNPIHTVTERSTKLGTKLGKTAVRRGPSEEQAREFFLCDMLRYALKDDTVSMEVPVFTLATKPDLTAWHWQSTDGNRVTPSILGRATQLDKDVLIYTMSQMTHGLNNNCADTRNRAVRFVVYDYLVATNKKIGGTEYKQLEAAMERLQGTSIKTNIKTGGQRIKERL